MSDEQFNNFRVSEVFNAEESRLELRKRIPLPASPDQHLDLVRRQQQEHNALTLVNLYCPDIVPELFDYQDEAISFQNQKYRYIAMESLDTNVSVGSTDLLDTIEQLQTRIPVPTPEESTLPVYESNTYTEKLQEMMNYLHDKGTLQGLTDYEISKITKRTSASLPAVSSFSTVFVHTDMQKRHFGKSQPDRYGQRDIKVFDFDQSHFGNELEDFTFSAVRHPEFANEIKQHLKNKFKEQPDKLENLDAALAFFSDYFLVKGMYDRVNQSREKLFDTAARWYGRLALNSSMFRSASEKTGKVLGGARAKVTERVTV